MMDKAIFDVRRLRALPGPGTREVTLNCRLDAGEMFVIRGPSGSGKTTLLRTLARLHTAEGGDVLLRGESWRTIPPRKWRRRIAYVPSRPRFVPGTAERNLELPFELRIAERETFPKERAAELLNAVLLDEAILSKETAVLSDGERARLSLVRALLTAPDVLLADEPTAALDDESARAVIVLLASEAAGRGLAMMTVSHDSRRTGGLDAKVIDIGGGAS